MRLKGKGMPRSDTSGAEPGDQYVEVLIQTPPADDADAREFYREMKARFDFNPRSF